MSRVLMLAGVCCLTACAQPAREITASYVSPVQYAAFSCEALANEAGRVTHRMAFLSGIQDEHARSDRVHVAAAAVVVGGATAVTGGLITGASQTAKLAAGTLGGVAAGSLVGLHGDDSTTTEIGRLKGELDAVERAFVRHGCGTRHPGPVYTSYK